ncbi:MAG TPA: hypothetical protein DDY13_11800 [Cytophagales bacterium]|jgi:ABC-type multidrug transport system fused ATPase/permease subunit|nr:hypothetical protein [Cytophagales bacterium]
MKIVFKMILISGITFFLQGYLPWWLPALSAFFVNAIIANKKGWAALGSSFFSITILWGWLSWRAYQNGADILAEKMALLFQIPAGAYLVIIVAVFGGIIAALGGLSGHYFRKLFERKKQVYY